MRIDDGGDVRVRAGGARGAGRPWTRTGTADAPRGRPRRAQRPLSLRDPPLETPSAGGRVPESRLPGSRDRAAQAILAALGAGGEMGPISMNDFEKLGAVSYTHLRAHETPEHLVCRLLL